MTWNLRDIRVNSGIPDSEFAFDPRTGAESA